MGVFVLGVITGMALYHFIGFLLLKYFERNIP
jgi:hypothetical protein